ncbi:MAG TPA: hydrolase [Pseudogracilibacillus sp.]|nr:hydrolase [Pseudogracilibacillus sp.]
MISPEETGLIVVDVQGKLANIVHESEFVVNQMEALIKGAQILDLPIIWMEQYPEGLGPTTDQLKRHLEDETYVTKRTFSACLEDQFMKAIEAVGRKSFLVIGIEAHVCVYQTVRDLLQKEYDVEIVLDAVSSRTESDRKIGIEKMRSLGATITSTEMALFELMKTSKHPRFKEVINLIK